MITKEYLLMAIVTSLIVIFLITSEQPVKTRMRILTLFWMSTLATTEIIMRLIKILFSL